MSTPIYVGLWTNWSHGAILGATLTLGARDSGLLTAFIATFVTLVAAQLWKILAFAIHQSRCRMSPQDGLHHQQQVIFRNTAAPGSAAWTFLLQSWFWRRKAKRSAIRTLLWALFAFVYIVVFGLLAIFSSEISKAPGKKRLVNPTSCGDWYFDPAMSFEDTVVSGLQKHSNDT